MKKKKKISVFQSSAQQSNPTHDQHGRNLWYPSRSQLNLFTSRDARILPVSDQPIVLMNFPVIL